MISWAHNVMQVLSASIQTAELVWELLGNCMIVVVTTVLLLLIIIITENGRLG